MCLRLTSLLARCLFNLIPNEKHNDNISTSSEDEIFTSVPQPKTNHYNLRPRMSINYVETSDVQLNTPENSDSE